jgi:hypothetical protein
MSDKPELNPFETPEIQKFEEPTKRDKRTILIDVSKMISPKGKPLRVELRRALTAQSVSKENPQVGDEYMLGLIDKETLPKVGKEFFFNYYKINNWPDFGKLRSDGPVKTLKEADGCFYFTTRDGDWRLKVLDSGN